jgi:hypothetical protein
MAAIEYGSYYWCVILNRTESSPGGESVHLHADELKVEPNGGLTFLSAGRRPPGTDPKQQNAGKQNGDSEKDTKSEKPGKDDGDGANEKDSKMIYIAFAPGSWRTVYAAKLQDGAPASVENWDRAAGNGSRVAAIASVNSGVARSG